MGFGWNQSGELGINWVSMFLFNLLAIARDKLNIPFLRMTPINLLISSVCITSKFVVRLPCIHCNKLCCVVVAVVVSSPWCWEFDDLFVGVFLRVNSACVLISIFFVPLSVLAGCFFLYFWPWRVQGAVICTIYLCINCWCMLFRISSPFAGAGQNSRRTHTHAPTRKCMYMYTGKHWLF